MSNIIQVEDLEKTKFHNTFHVEAVTGKVGGLASGADIDFTTNAVTGQVQATLPKILSQVGFVPANFDFSTGGTLSITDRNKAIFYETDGNWYSWGGALPKTIPPLSSPASTGGIADNAWNVSTSAFMYRDWEGFTAELLAQAGIVDDGQPDKLGDSKRVNALHALFDVYGTLAEVAAGKFQLGKTVLIIERNAPFKIEVGTPDGYGKVAAGGMNVAVVQVQDVWSPRAFGAAADSATDDTLPVKAMVAHINSGDLKPVTINLEGRDIVVSGTGIFKFGRYISKLTVTNGRIIWKPTLEADNLFTIDPFVGRIVSSVDIFTSKDVPDNIPRGDVFYFSSNVGEYASTHNSIENSYITGNHEDFNYAPIRNIINSQGHGNNDQSQVVNCRLEGFYTAFRCNNPESVGWVFDLCGMFTVTANARMFWFDTLSSGFTIKRGSFSLLEQDGEFYQTILYAKANNAVYPPPDDAAFVMDNVRVETYSRSGTGSDNIRIIDVDFGRVTMSNCFTNTGNNVPHDFITKDESALFLDNTQLGTARFITEDSVQAPPYQTDFVTMINGSCRDIPSLISNNQPMAYEYLSLPFNTRRAVFKNVTDVVSGRVLNFSSYTNKAAPMLSESIATPNEFSILQPLSMVRSIKFAFSKVVTATYPKVRVTVAKNIYVATFDLPTAEGDFELLPENYFLMYLFDNNTSGLSAIKFQLLDALNTPSSAVIEADVQISYSALSPRVASVVGNIDVAKIANIYGAPLVS